MEQIKAILEKIEKVAAGQQQYSSIDRDLMLQYTRELYELLLNGNAVPSTQQLTEEPEPMPQDVPPAIVNADEVKKENLILEPINVQQEKPIFNALPKQESITEHIVARKDPNASISYSEETAAERLPFELEPELQSKSKDGFFAKVTDFKIWNKDIRTYIGINDRYNFISELFQNNTEAYEEILNEINQCETKAAALTFLDNSGITTLYHWKDEGNSEQTFYTALSQFFASR